MDPHIVVPGAVETLLSPLPGAAQTAAKTPAPSESADNNDVMKASYTRIFTDGGASKFEDLSIELKKGFAVPPAEPLHMAPFLAATSSYWIGAPTTWSGSAPHPAPRRQIFVTLRGAYRVSLPDGASRDFPAGSVFVIEDTTGSGHSSVITGAEDALIFAVALA